MAWRLPARVDAPLAAAAGPDLEGAASYNPRAGGFVRGLALLAQPPRTPAQRRKPEKHGVKRGSYVCGKCGLPKKGHQCEFKDRDVPPRKFSRTSGERRAQRRLAHSAGGGSGSSGGQAHHQQGNGLPVHHSTLMDGGRRHDGRLFGGDASSPEGGLPPETPTAAQRRAPYELTPSPPNSSVAPAAIAPQHQLWTLDVSARSFASRGPARFVLPSGAPADGACASPVARRPLALPRGVLAQAELPHASQVALLGALALPEAVVLQLLGTLPPDALFAAGATCRRWRALAECTCRGAETASIVLGGGGVPPAPLLRRVGERCAGLRSLSLRTCVVVDDALLAAAGAALPRLASLRLDAPRELNAVTKVGLAALATALPNLADLRLDGAAALVELDIASASLARLWISGAENLQSVSLACPALRSLALDLDDAGAAPVEPDGGRVVSVARGVAESCNGLRELSVATGSLTDAAAAALLSGDPSSVRALCLTRGAGVTDDTARIIASRCVGLELLDLSESAKLTDAGVATATAPFAATLRRLLLAQCAGLTQRAAVDALDALHHLEQLDVGGSLSGYEPPAEAPPAATPGSPLVKPVARRRSARNVAAPVTGEAELTPSFADGPGGWHGPASAVGLLVGARPPLKLASRSLRQLSLRGCVTVEQVELSGLVGLEFLDVSGCDALGPDAISLHGLRRVRAVLAEACPDGLVDALRWSGPRGCFVHTAPLPAVA